VVLPTLRLAPSRDLDAIGVVTHRKLCGRGEVDSRPDLPPTSTLGGSGGRSRGLMRVNARMFRSGRLAVTPRPGPGPAGRPTRPYSRP
jgi:hypothetical protein